jgi:predicted ATPase
VLLGPNGSGKSTIFDVFNFLSECFTIGLRKAWEKRGRFRDLRSRGQDGPIIFRLQYRETENVESATYYLAIDERDGVPVVTEEWLQWRRVAKNTPGRPYKILSFKNGAGWVISGKTPVPQDEKVREKLDEPDLLAVGTLGRLDRNPRVAALRRFITNWYVSYLSIDDARGQPESGAQERLSKSGDNLANVIQYLQDKHPTKLREIFDSLRQRVPLIESVDPIPMPDGRLLLALKDVPFKEPIPARFASDGTLKTLAYLVVLHDPKPPDFIGIEEPENFLHPRLLPLLAEECRAATERSQLLVTTHSPFFLNALKPEEVRVLYRDEHGFTQAQRTSDIAGIPEFIEEGAQLGHLWLEGHLNGEGDGVEASRLPQAGASRMRSPVAPGKLSSASSKKRATSAQDSARSR